MSQKFRLNFVQQNDSMIYFLSAIVYLFYALISEYIETLNCLNFSKNRKNCWVCSGFQKELATVANPGLE